jgi:Ca-activated chloride channel family protein
MHFSTKSVSSTLCLFFSALLCFNAVRISAQAIRVQVDMVSLPVVVTDENGRYVTNLRSEDFKVLDDGVLQEIAGFAAVTEPVSVALMLDTSGSTEFQLERIRDEAILFVKSLKPEDSVAILSFADQVQLLEPFSIYQEKNPEAIRRIKPGGLSAVYEAVWLAIENVLKYEYGRKALVLFSDGVDNRSETVSREETLDLARRTESPIYCVYFNTDEDRYKRMPPIIDPFVEPLQGFHWRSQWPPFGRPRGPGKKHPEYAAGYDYLGQLAHYSGGLLMDTKGMEDLRSAFQRVVRELSSQYSVGYYPNNLKHDGKLHKVEVRVNRPGLKARTRQGYFAPQP